jgi:hypothetical protein
MFMRRLISAGTTVCVAAVVIGVFATPIASAQQSFNVYIGGFTPKSEDGRTSNDVLVNDLTIDPALAFKISDFNAFTFGGEYLVGLGPLFEAGLGIGYQSSSVPSVYADLTNSDGSEIEQTLKLRDHPLSAARAQSRRRAAVCRRRRRHSRLALQRNGRVRRYQQCHFPADV